VTMSRAPAIFIQQNQGQRRGSLARDWRDRHPGRGVCKSGGPQARAGFAGGDPPQVGRAEDRTAILR